MAINDLFLLDGVLDARVAEAGAGTDRAELFERFCFEQVLKEYTPSSDEIEFGWVDGKDDGGIDGLYCFLDGLLVTERPRTLPRAPELDLYVITSKHEDTFRQAPVDQLLASMPELMDLRRSDDALSSIYNENVLRLRRVFAQTYRDLSHRLPTLRLHFVYASRGDETSVADNIRARADALVEAMHEMFSAVECDVRFWGSQALLRSYRKRPPVSLSLRLIENVISRGPGSYVVLARLSDYARLLVDDEGVPRRYLFDANVRDFLGTTPVNEDILATLGEAEGGIDFWWLNNGVTIVARSAHVVGKEITLTGLQIVNGLQTSQSILHHFMDAIHRQQTYQDERAIIIKVIVTEDAAVRDRVIKATNNQNSVEIASLRATDPTQVDIEQAFGRSGWHYDRRKNFYENEGKPQARIITPVFVAACIYAVVLRQPSRGRLKSRFMRKDVEYLRVFDSHRDLRLYVHAVELVKRVEQLMYESRSLFPSNPRFVGDWRFLLTYVLVVRKLGRVEYGESEIRKIDPSAFTEADVIDAWELARTVNRGSRLGPWLSSGERLTEAMVSSWGVIPPKRGESPKLRERRKESNLPAPPEGWDGTVAAEFVSTIDRLLPPQPWPPGVHVGIANMLRVSKLEVSVAIKTLIEQGRRHNQVDGVVFDRSWLMVSYDKKRLSPAKADEVAIRVRQKMLGPS